MDLSIQKLSKAFNQKKIFTDLSFDIQSGSRFAITGPNGSGKSTLLKILSGGALPSFGQILYKQANKVFSGEEIFRHVHFVAPYNTVIEELSLEELFKLHKRLGMLQSFQHFNEWASMLEYSFNSSQQIKMFSSGMKQRVKLGLAILDDRPLIFLDEPGSNLDIKGKEWLASLVNQKKDSQTLIIASNDSAEIALCQQSIDLVTHA
ncbi:MAG: ATP-binding cassette domain-containing protein [Bacteroidota bacterium]|nr:ATP-binding cassette domain-containing protein [Bacteroidota bacterium]